MIDTWNRYGSRDRPYSGEYEEERMRDRLQHWRDRVYYHHNDSLTASHLFRYSPPVLITVEKGGYIILTLITP